MQEIRINVTRILKTTVFETDPLIVYEQDKIGICSKKVIQQRLKQLQLCAQNLRSHPNL